MAGFQTLYGFRAFYPDDCARRNHLFALWRNCVRRFGFREFDPPILEPLELFTEKSGPEIVGQLFNFTDKGGREVALRPEITPSLARLVGAQINALSKPVKWFAIGENFRYERPQKGRLRSHYQLNVDILGEASVEADAELIAVLLHTLGGCGLSASDCALRLSDRQLWSLWLESFLGSAEAVGKVLSVVDKMERDKPEAVLEKIEGIVGSARGQDLIARIEAFRSLPTVEDVRAFFAGLGDRSEAVEARLKALEDVLALLADMGLAPFVRLDFGIVRGLAYYTGFVFEVFALDNRGQFCGRAVAGGGRYDHLLGKLGYPDTPAVGFGLGDVVLSNLLAEKKLLPPLIHKPDVFVVSAEGAPRAAARADAMALRSVGISVEYPLKAIAFDKQFKLAGQSGARYCLIYEAGENNQQDVRIRDLANGQQQNLARGQIRDFLLNSL